MIDQIEKWIDDNNIYYSGIRQSCTIFSDEFNGFYSHEFLTNSYFVPVDKIPKPDFPGLRNMGLGNFIDMPVTGITYKDTYYIINSAVQDLRLHFHELVHVAQWSFLGAGNFIERYIREIQTVGYSEAPLEKMANYLDSYYFNNNIPFDVPNYVKEKI